MKKLSKTRIKQFNEIVEIVKDSQEKLDSAIEEYNNALDEKWAVIQAAQENYNTAISDAVGFAEEISNDMNEYFDERSESWQESEKGDSYREWIDEWENIELEESNLEQPEFLPEVGSEMADLLEELKTEFDV